MKQSLNKSALGLLVSLGALVLLTTSIQALDKATGATTKSLRAAAESPSFLTLLQQAQKDHEKAHNSEANDQQDDSRRQLLFGRATDVIVDFFNQVDDVVKTVSIDPRFDPYTTGLAAGNAIAASNWEIKTAADVFVPTEQTDVQLTAAGLFSEIKVPTSDEHFGQTEQVFVTTTLNYAKALTFPHTADHCGRFREGEDAEAIVKLRLFGGENPARVLVKWGPDKYSDESLELLVFHGMGQHRITKVRADDPHAQTPNGPAAFAVYLSFAEGLETRPGFAKLGADAYFDTSGKILSIVRLGKTWTPQGEQGSVAVEKCWKMFGLKLSCKRTPAVIGWQHAKLAFRSTLHGVTTAVDHLIEHHLVAANSMVVATMPELPPAHPMRRLLTPFGFRTENINYQAAFALINERGLVHRAFPLTKNGMLQMYAAAKAALTFKTVPQKFADSGVDALSTDVFADGKLALHVDGLDFYESMRSFVSKYIALYYPAAAEDTANSDACTRDADLTRWYSRLNSLQPHQDLPALSSKSVEDVLATFFFAVTAGHNHVGSINSEVEDPCFMPWSFVEGELCGRPRTFYTQAVTFALTSLEMPKLMEDYTHMFEQEEAKQIWRDFTSSLTKLQERVDKRNEKRPREFRSFDVTVVETAIGI